MTNSACRYAQALDKPVRYDPVPKKDHSALIKRVLKRFKTGVVPMILQAVILVSSQSYAYGVSNIDAYKLYAHQRITAYEEFTCYVELIDRESHWNPLASNGNHWGMVQSADKRVKTMTAYQQIDWSLTYIAKRYQTACRALHHSYIMGWY